MENTELTQVNIFFKIDDPLYSEVIDTSHEIKKKHNLACSLDNKRFLPHLSLYLFALFAKNLPALIQKAKEIAGEMKPINLQVEDVIAAENNIVMVQFKKKNILYQYHLKAINTLNPLREGAQRKKYTNEKEIKKLENKHRKYIKRYGHRFILDQYHPHISIAACKTHENSLEIAEKYKKAFKGKVAKTESLCIIEDDYETGDARKLLFEQKL